MWYACQNSWWPKPNFSSNNVNYIPTVLYPDHWTLFCTQLFISILHTPHRWNTLTMTIILAATTVYGVHNSDRRLGQVWWPQVDVEWGFRQLPYPSMFSLITTNSLPAPGVRILIPVAWSTIRQFSHVARSARQYLNIYLKKKRQYLNLAGNRSRDDQNNRYTNSTKPAAHSISW